MMQCTVLSKEQILFEGTTQSITVPAITGEAEILQGHPEAFFLFQEGMLSILGGSEDKKIHVTEGVCFFYNNSATILL